MRHFTALVFSFLPFSLLLSGARAAPESASAPSGTQSLFTTTRDADSRTQRRGAAQSAPRGPELREDPSQAPRFALRALPSSPALSRKPIRPGQPEWPLAWASYRTVKSPEADFADLKAHGVGLVSHSTGSADDLREALALARRTGMKYHIDFPEITERADLIRSAGLTPVDALLIGGVYQGKAIDHHLFSFTPGRHEIVIEPPVYNKGLAYTRGSGGTGQPKAAERVGHYFPEIGAPLRAEVIVPLKAFDGKQHLRILPATVSEAPPGAKPENDTVTPDLLDASETRNRKLYRLSFDLSGLQGALLDRVGIAVYWAYHGSDQYWMFGRGNASAWAESTRQALRTQVQATLKRWSDANGGTFPLDVVLAGRFGDECFYITSHSGPPMVSYPLWDYSEPAVRAFRRHAGKLEYPRTWGFPEVYGSDAYGWWLYTLHEGCARLCGVAREEIARAAPGLLLFRNTTRAGVFDASNDHDGSGQELLARNLDILHLDPYPVSAGGYGANIPRDMSYCAGLARRYRRILVPWMQAHIYGGPGGLQHVSPEQVERMAAEQRAQGVDAVMWLGYGPGNTFPKTNPASWEMAGVFHKLLAENPPPKPKARLAVLRSYRAWALSSRVGDKVRNPADWMLQQLLEVWAVRSRQAYDVFEVPPALSTKERAALAAELKRYPFVVSTEPWPGAWVIGEGTMSQSVDPATAEAVRKGFEAELQRRGWLGGKTEDRRQETGIAQTGHGKPGTSVDLRSQLEAWGLPPRPQGARGTCSVFAVTAGLEYALAKKTGKGTPLSVEYLNWAANQTRRSRRDGGFFHELWHGFEEMGICPETLAPYAAQWSEGFAPSEEARKTARELRLAGLQWHWIKAWDVTTGLTEEHFAAIKKAIAAGWPICAGLRWPKGAGDWKGGILQPCPADQVFDGHSILLTGYVDDPSQPGGGYFRFKDSAGAAYRSMSYAYAREYMNDAGWVGFGGSQPVAP